MLLELKYIEFLIEIPILPFQFILKHHQYLQSTCNKAHE